MQVLAALRKRSLLLVTVLLLAGAAHAQAWPARAVRITVPFAAGSSPDVMARILAERLAQRLGQPVLVDNRPGAGGNSGTGAVAKAAGDGYSFLLATNGPLVYNSALYRQLPYDPFTDLRPVVLAGGQANVCAVRADSGISSLRDLVEAMRRRPGRLNFASTGVGSLSHLGVELLKVRTGTFAVHIPYASSPQAVMAVLQDEVQFACVPALAVLPHVRSGRLRMLAVSTARRSPFMPEVPTMQEAGLADIESMAWMALVAPASTPADVVARMNREVNAVLALPEVKDRLQAQAMLPLGGSPQDLQRFMRNELRVMQPVIRRTGIVID